MYAQFQQRETSRPLWENVHARGARAVQILSKVLVKAS